MARRFPFLFIALFGSTLLVGAQTALASSPELTVASPSSGQTVPRVFTITGSAPANTYVGLLVDGKGYIDPQDRPSAKNAGHGGAIPGYSDSNGSFSFSVDLNGRAVLDDARGTYPVAAGTHQFVLTTFYTETSLQSVPFTLDVQGEDLTATASPNPVLAASSANPSPLPSSSALPATSPPTVKGASLSPAAWVGIATAAALILLLVVHQLSPSNPKKKRR